MTRVLLTGPSGRIGPTLVGAFENNYQLRLFDLQPSDFGDSVVGDLADLSSLRAAMRDIEVVVHLAATSDEAPFLEELVPNNIVGMFNLLEAARLEKVRRVVFASSVQTVGYALRGDVAGVETETMRPNSLYGATKIMGETLGRYYHDRHDLEFIALRLGCFMSVEDAKDARRSMLEIWLSPDDCAQLFRRAIDTPNIGYAVVNGTSITPVERLSLRSAREILGYQPSDTI